MADTPEKDALDVDGPWSEVDVPDMTAEERAREALRVQYEIVRTLVALESLTAYQAELAGASPEEVDATTDRAEEDEFASRVVEEEA